MPRQNGNGPMGYGPRIGKGLGRCEEFDTSGNVTRYSRGSGRGNRHCHGFGGGLGFGRGNCMTGPDMQPGMPDDEKRLLENQMETLQNQLSAVKTRLENLGARETQSL